MAQKHRGKLIQDLVKRLAVETHHGYVSLIISRCKQLAPWRQLQRDQSASWDLSISSAALLDRKTSEEILPIPGVHPLGPRLVL